MVCDSFFDIMNTINNTHQCSEVFFLRAAFDRRQTHETNSISCSRIVGMSSPIHI